MPFAKPTKKQLEECNVLVQRHSRGAAFRVAPVTALRDPIERFLPPLGLYYDQTTLEAYTGSFNHKARCVLCWNYKSNRACKCRNKCAVCNTIKHRKRECPMLYADIKWWQAHGHQLGKEVLLRPNPGERAYLFVANVLKDWKGVTDPVLANMENSDVVAFYEGKEVPRRLTDLPPRLRTNPPASSTAPSNTFPVVLEPDAEGMKGSLHNSGRIPTNSTTEVGSLTTEDNDGLIELLNEGWQAPSYHEGTRYATVTPLSMRPAVTSAQQYLLATQPVMSQGNEVHTDLDPRLKARKRPQQYSGASQPSSATAVTPSRGIYNDGVEPKNGNEDFRRELEKAREEIKAKDQRIRELEIALQEGERWTDTVTYRAGQKRLRD